MRIKEFWTTYPVGKPPVDWVRISPMGDDFDRTDTPHKVHTLDPERFPEGKRIGPSYDAAVFRWSIIKPAYDAWKAGNELPETGTPLEAWAGITKETAMALRANDIRTVEEVVEMGDRVMEKLKLPNARRLPEMAKAYLDGKDAAAKDAEMAEMREKMKLLEEALNEKPKRGRPKKEESDAVA